MISPMKYSKSGFALTEGFEACVLKPYPDEAGVWSDGYGNTHGVIPHGPEITPEKAVADLEANVQTAVNCVNNAVTVDSLSQDQFDALVDFTFNVGIGAFRSSTLLKCINTGDLAGADSEFARWNMAGGHVSNGLVRRRAAEAAEFLR